MVATKTIVILSAAKDLLFSGSTLLPPFFRGHSVHRVPARVAPMTVRRMKTYTGGQGYVYQYYFVGKRPAVRPGEAAIEYIFDVTSDRKTTYAVSVLVEAQALQAWTQAHGRAPTEAEEYGAAKMRLFQAFDEVENMFQNGRELLVDEAELEAVLGSLGIN